MGKRKRTGSSFSRNGHDANRGGLSNGRLDMSGAYHPHGVGASRLAYRCRVQDGCYRGYTDGSYLIFKVFKPEEQFRQLQVDGDDVTMQLEAKRLAERFNKECSPTRYGKSCNIYLRDAALGVFEDDEQLLDDDGCSFNGRQGQAFLLEREIRGEFEKFNSNTGWNSGVDPILDAFSHWTWVETGGDKLVCDLQGHRGDGGLPYLGDPYYYLLTDPAICSECREYGENDLGKAGINAFFKHHACNEWCDKLGIDADVPCVPPPVPSFWGSASVATTNLVRTKSTSYHSLVSSARYY